jgi:hypothetical protein
MAGRWPPETLDTLFQVRPGFLSVWQRGLAGSFGGVQGYLRRRLGLTDAALRTLRAFYLTEKPVEV